MEKDNKDNWWNKAQFEKSLNEIAEDVRDEELKKILKRATFNNKRVVLTFFMATLGIVIVLLYYLFPPAQQPFIFGIGLFSFLSGCGSGLYIYLEKSNFDRMLIAFANSQNKTNNQIDSKNKIQVIEDDLDRIRDRISKETEKLGRRATVNLIFGSISTLTAIIFLGIQISSKSDLKFDKEHLSDFFGYLIPRLSVAIFIEIFAFFFLKVYRTTLGDIKYSHNELTNIEQHILSLKIATLIDDQTVIATVVKKLADTERNFILKKGESTVELEKAKHEDEGNKYVLDALKSMVKMKIGGSE